MTNIRSFFYTSLIVAALLTAGCFQVGSDKAVLQLDNGNGKSISLTKNDLTKFRRSAIVAANKEGETSRYEGVEMVEVLRMAGVPLGDELRREKMTSYVVVESADGYKVSFTLAELDPDFSDKKVILATTRDGNALDEDEGPLRLIVPDETNRQARWVRRVAKVTVKSGD